MSLDETERSFTINETLSDGKHPGHGMGNDTVNGVQVSNTPPPVECSSYTETAILCLSSSLEGICFYIIIFRVLPALYRDRRASDQNLRLAIWFLIILINITINFYEFLEINVFRTTSWLHKVRFNFYFIGLIESIYAYGTVGLAVEPLSQLFQLAISRRQSWLLWALLSLGVPVVYLLATMITWESEYEWVYIAWEGFTELTLVPTVVVTGQVAVLIWGVGKVLASRDTAVRARQVILMSIIVIISAINNGVLVMTIYSHYSSPSTILPIVIIVTDLIDSFCKVLLPILFLAVSDDDSWLSRRLMSNMVRKGEDSTPVVEET